MGNFLKGYKAKIGALNLVLAGLALIVSAFQGDTIDFARIMEGWASISLGLAAFGLRVALPGG